MLFQREYYDLREASEKLKCSVMDILHLSSTDELTWPIYAYLNLERYDILCCNDIDKERVVVLKVPYTHIGLASISGFDIREIIRLGGFENNILITQANPHFSIDSYVKVHCHHHKINFDSLKFEYYTMEQRHPNIEGWEISKPFIASDKTLFLRAREIELLMNRKNDEIPILPKGEDSMIKIIHALAKNGYKYPNHGSIKEMVDDFERNDNGVSEKTLKKYLNMFDKL